MRAWPEARRKGVKEKVGGEAGSAVERMDSARAEGVSGVVVDREVDVDVAIVIGSSVIQRW
jgi:hypothetical protein